MAYLFNGAAKLVSPTAIITAAPITLAFFFKHTAAATQVAVSLDEGVTAANSFQMFTNAGADTLTMLTNSGASSSTSSTNGAPPTAWNAAVGVSQSSSSRYAILNGIMSAESTGVRLPVGISEFIIGGRGSGSASWNGLLAEVALWNVALTPKEAMRYSEGTPASFIRPESLFLYMPLRDTVADLGPQQFTSFTNTAAVPNSDHPRILQPLPRRLRRFRRAA